MMDLLLDCFDRLRRTVLYDAQVDFYYRHFPSLVENAECIMRPMVRTDIPLVHAIETKAYEFPWDLETFRSCFKVGYHCWIAERAREVVGYGILTIGAGESHVLNVCVSPQYQGRGYGRVIFNQLIQEARRYKVETMFLEVRPSNPKAIKLYRSIGFNEIGTRRGYYPAKSGREDAMVMALAIL
jgi:ribosomal-protein-alanine N-acetyltransferase